jgi:hypothetical protein
LVEALARRIWDPELGQRTTNGSFQGEDGDVVGEEAYEDDVEDENGAFDGGEYAGEEDEDGGFDGEGAGSV